ncbi:hypothetical protein [Streptomyces sp. HC307]|uniref:hypothetical protein n=1 Tax=Streptomyces flavusporus TaxID=3385496 RepID=UPI003916F426
MSDRHLGFRGAAGRAAPFAVLHCAALLAVVLWVLPVCTHSADEAFRVPVASDTGNALGAGAVRTAATHECPDMEHGPGDTHCRPAAQAVANTAFSVPVPPLRAADVTVAAWTPHAPPARGAPEALVHTPGIHQLQIQRT